MSISYYIGSLGSEANSSEQAKYLRAIILSGKDEAEILATFTQFVLNQNSLKPDTERMINKALMANYGLEYLGLAGDDFDFKSTLYKQFIAQFPEVFSFKFYFSESCLLAGIPVGEFYPVLKEGMLQDKENVHYPSADLFELIHDSAFSFDFDMLLLDKYYQPCDKDTFDDWISEFKEDYTKTDQLSILENLTWKGQ